MAAMSLFGSDEKKEARAAEVRKEIERLGALRCRNSPRRSWSGFTGPMAPGKGGRRNYQETLSPFDPTDTGIFPGVDKELRVPLEELIQEGMQELTNSALVVVPFRGGDITNPRYRLTRAGWTALASGDIATRIAR